MGTLFDPHAYNLPVSSGSKISTNENSGVRTSVKQGSEHVQNLMESMGYLRSIDFENLDQLYHFLFGAALFDTSEKMRELVRMGQKILSVQGRTAQAQSLEKILSEPPAQEVSLDLLSETGSEIRNVSVLGYVSDYPGIARALQERAAQVLEGPEDYDRPEPPTGAIESPDMTVTLVNPPTQIVQERNVEPPDLTQTRPSEGSLRRMVRTVKPARDVLDFKPELPHVVQETTEEYQKALAAFQVKFKSLASHFKWGYDRTLARVGVRSIHPVEFPKIKRAILNSMTLMESLSSRKRKIFLRMLGEIAQFEKRNRRQLPPHAYEPLLEKASQPVKDLFALEVQVRNQILQIKHKIFTSSELKMIHQFLVLEEKMLIASRGAHHGLAVDNIQVHKVEVNGKGATATVQRNGDFFAHSIAIGDKNEIRYGIHASDLLPFQLGKFIYNQLTHNSDKVSGGTFSILDIYAGEKTPFHRELILCKHIEFVDPTDDRLYKISGGTAFVPPFGNYVTGDKIKLTADATHYDAINGAQLASHIIPTGAVSFSSPHAGESLRFGLLMAKNQAQANGWDDKATHSLLSKLVPRKEGRIRRHFRPNGRHRLISTQFRQRVSSPFSCRSPFRATRL